MKTTPHRAYIVVAVGNLDDTIVGTYAATPQGQTAAMARAAKLMRDPRKILEKVTWQMTDSIFVGVQIFLAVGCKCTLVAAMYPDEDAKAVIG